MEDDQEDPLVECAVSGEMRRKSQMLPFGEEWVSPEHKDTFVQKLAEVVYEERADVVEGHPFETRLTFTSMINQAWKIWASQWKLILLMTAIVMTPFYLIAEYFSYEVFPSGEDEFGELRTELKIDRAIEFWVGSFIFASLYAFSSLRWNGGRRQSLKEFFQLGGSNYGRLIGTKFLVGLILVIVVLLSVVPIFFLEIEAVQIGLGIVAVCFCVFLFIRLGNSEALAIVEGRGGNEALASSWRLTKGKVWQLIFYRVGFYVPVVFVAFLAAIPMAIPFLDHFFVSAIVSAVIFFIMTLTKVFETVLAIHLQAAHDRALEAEEAGGGES